VMCGGDANKHCCVGGTGKCCNTAAGESCCNGQCCDSSHCCVNGECKPICSGGPETAEFCICSSLGGSGWVECSVQKVYHTCLCIGNCNNTNRIEVNTGPAYSSRTVVLEGRWCCGGFTYVQGVDYVGQYGCSVTYYGCD
jgi:hypothetical protein